MSLTQEYQQQDHWRQWEQFLPELPLRPGMRILDLGCSIGTMAGLLAQQGVEVTAIDNHPELLAFARSRQLPGVVFLEGDLSRPEQLNLPHQAYDGIWCSFVPAYFPDLTPHLMAWSQWLKPGGSWIALLEIDDLLVHRPIAPAFEHLLKQFVASAASRYDFCMGRKLSLHLQAAGFTQIVHRTVSDPELTLKGPVTAEVLDGWERRLERMKGLQQFCGEDFPALKAALLKALAHPQHTSDCQVVFALAGR